MSPLDDSLDEPLPQGHGMLETRLTHKEKEELVVPVCLTPPFLTMALSHQWTDTSQF